MPPSAADPGVPPDLEAVVAARAGEGARARRYADADEFIAALEAARARIVAARRGQTTAFGVVARPVVGAADADWATTRRRRKSWPWSRSRAVDRVPARDRRRLLLTGPRRPATVPNVPAPSRGRGARAAQRGLQAGRRARAQRAAPGPRDRAGPGARQGARGRRRVAPIGLGWARHTRGAQRRGAWREKEASQAWSTMASRSATEEPSDDVREGRVIETRPDRARRSSVGARLTIVVSTGPEQVTVPDVVGENVDDARRASRRAGLQVRRRREETDDDDPDTVLRQDPPAGRRSSRARP